jgi:hypothetical protein
MIEPEIFSGPGADHPMHDPLENVGRDLDETRAQIDTTRAALQAALDAQDVDLEPVRQAVARLDQIATELKRVETMVGDQAVGGRSRPGRADGPHAGPWP